MRWSEHESCRLAEELASVENEQKQIQFQCLIADSPLFFLGIWFMGFASHAFGLWLFVHNMGYVGHVVFLAVVLPVFCYFCLVLWASAINGWLVFSPKYNSTFDLDECLIMLFLGGLYPIIRDAVIGFFCAVIMGMFFGASVDAEDFVVWCYWIFVILCSIAEFLIILLYLHPDLPVPILEKGLEMRKRAQGLREALNQLQEARTQWQARVSEIRRRKPDTPLAFAERGRDFLEEGLLDEALVNIEAAIIMDANCAEAHMWRGMVLAAQGKGHNKEA